MGETARRHSDLERGGKGIGLDRMLFFSDAVFAIAITLLVIDLGVETHDRTTTQIASEMLAAWPSYVAYVISFSVIGANWVAHHRNMSLLVRYDTGLLWLNLALLMFVAFLPYPTRMMFPGKGGIQPTQFAFYAGTVCVIGLLQAALWAAAWAKRYLDPDRIDERLFRYMLAQAFVTPVVFAGSLLIEAIAGPPWSLYFWLLQIPLSILTARIEPRERVSRSPD